MVLRREARAGVALVDSKLCFSWQGCWGHTVPSLCPHVLIELLILGRHRSDPSRFAWPPRWERITKPRDRLYLARRITKPRDRLHLARRGQSSVHFAASGSWGRKFSPCKYFHPSLVFFFPYHFVARKEQIEERRERRDGENGRERGWGWGGGVG